MMNPYSNPVEKIKDVSKYFKKDEKDFSITFVGETLELRIPFSFKKHDALVIGDSVTTPGIFDMIIDDKYQAGFNLLASITIEPSDTYVTNIGGYDYQVLILKNGDKFMTSYRVIQNPHIVYVLWTEWITEGKIGYWVTYDDLLKIFANVKELTGSGIGVSRSVFEGIIAHISRDKNNPTLQYRLTDMKKPMSLVALNSVALAPTGNLARINGNYFTDTGLTSAVLIKVEQDQPFENILRGIPTSVLEDRFEQW